MPLFVAALVGALVSAAGSFIGRAMIALGIGYLTFTGLSAALDGIQSMVIARFQSAGQLVGIIAIFKVDVAITIIFSALAARLLLQGLQSDKLTKLIIK